MIGTQAIREAREQRKVAKHTSTHARFFVDYSRPDLRHVYFLWDLGGPGQEVVSFAAWGPEVVEDRAIIGRAMADDKWDVVDPEELTRALAGRPIFQSVPLQP